jgi:membrane fusion protein (multidrug efflux system)
MAVFPQAMKNIYLIYWVAIAASVALTSCEKPKATAETGPPEVLVTEVMQREVPIIREWVGTLNGVQNAQISARVEGYLTTIAYQQGGHVKKGDLLFQIDPRPFQASLDQAKAQLQQDQATLLQVESDAKRAQELFAGRVISAQEYTDKTQTYQAKLAAVAADQAAVEQAQLNLGFTKIVSPLDGIAGKEQAQIGDLVGTSSGTVLTTVSQIDPIWCYFPISEQDYWAHAESINRMVMVPEEKRPENVELILPEGSVYKHKGRFAFINRQVESTTGTIQVAASFPNPELTLRPGQYVTARAEVDQLPNALLIPRQAVSVLQGSDQIGIVNPDGKAEIRAVRLGEIYGQMVVVKEGVKAGEKVIVEGFQTVRQAMPVTAKPYPGSFELGGTLEAPQKNSRLGNF